ncbi:MAG: hypothetical protein AAF231_09940, partial [Pseudomonadota bacterium]
MQYILTAIALILSTFTTAAKADTIVVNGRYIVAKEDIRGYFYRDGRATVFDIRWSDWSTQYKCADEYDRTRIEAAMLNLSLRLEDARSVD